MTIASNSRPLCLHLCVTSLLSGSYMNLSPSRASPCTNASNHNNNTTNNSNSNSNSNRNTTTTTTTSSSTTTTTTTSDITTHNDTNDRRACAALALAHVMVFRDVLLDAVIRHDVA